MLKTEIKNTAITDEGEADEKFMEDILVETIWLVYGKLVLNILDNCVKLYCPFDVLTISRRACSFSVSKFFDLTHFL